MSDPTTLSIAKKDYDRFLKSELAYSKLYNKKLSHTAFFSIIMDEIDGCVDFLKEEKKKGY